jgi:hypothetical protein
MIEGISAVTLGTHEMPRVVRFYRALGFEVLYSGEESSFTSFRAGVSYLNLIAQPAEQHWSWWGRVVELRIVGVEGVLLTEATHKLPPFSASITHRESPWK